MTQKNVLYFLLSSIFFFNFHAQIPTKTIQIYNNTDEIIYPILETPMLAVDMWLQAAFGEKNISHNLYASNRIYRVYINPNNGILPHTSVTLNVPFYSQLTQNPIPSLPNQYINWWNGIRIYLYDDKTALNNVYNQDKVNIISPLTPGISCQGSCESLVIFPSDHGLPLNDPYQLVEYTWANLNIQTIPYQIFTNFVDYDLSYVDHTYLPIAIEPYNNNSVGYTGTIQDLPTFRNILNKFAADKGWPHYIQTPQYQNIRLPGAYNMLIGVDLNDQNSIAKQNVEQFWTNCVNNPANNTMCQNISIVAALFNKNYQNYLSFPCVSHLPLTLDLMLQHVYGWVPFNECVSNGFDNALYNTPGINYENSVKAYHDLQYSYLTNSNNEFNPYVELIHGKNYLNMDAYAYSIDDAVGNINTIGDGIIITVGGKFGLPNPNPYNSNINPTPTPTPTPTPNPAQNINVNLGAPSAGKSWISYGIGTNTPNILLNGKLTFQIPASTIFPVQISLKDSARKMYAFTIKQGYPLPSSGIICNLGDSWCPHIVVNTNTQKDINTPPPL